MTIPTNLRINEHERDLLEPVLDMIRDAGFSETPAQVLHQAIHDGLMIREKKLRGKGA